MAKSSTYTPDIRKLMTYMADRNGTIEIAAMEKSDDQEVEEGFHKSRVLDVHDDYLILERPIARKVPIRVASGQDLYCLMIANGQRWSFKTRAMGGQVYQLNEKTRIPAIRASWPTQLQPGQRRDYYRVQMPLEHRIQVNITPITDPHSAVDAEKSNLMEIRQEWAETQEMGVRLPMLEGPIIHAELKDLTAEGIGLLVPILMTKHLKEHPMFWITMTMPMVGPFCGVIERVYYIKRSSRMTQAGFKFLYQHHPERQRIMTNLIHKSTNDIQREVLKKRSGQS